MLYLYVININLLLKTTVLYPIKQGLVISRLICYAIITIYPLILEFSAKVGESQYI